MTENKENMTPNYREVILDFLKNNFIDYNISEDNPNVICSFIECKAANSKFPLAIIASEDSLFWIISILMPQIPENRRDGIISKFKAIEKNCHFLSLGLADNGVVGIVKPEFFKGDEIKQTVRNVYFGVKEELESCWLHIINAVFAESGDGSSLAQFKRIIESENESINLTIEEETAFSGMRYIGRMTGFAYALIITRGDESSDAIKIVSDSKILKQTIKRYTTEQEQKSLDHLQSTISESFKKQKGCNSDALLGQIEGIFVFVNQLNPILLAEERDIPLGGKVTINRKEEPKHEEKEEPKRIYSQEDNFNDTYSAFLNWHKSADDIKRILTKRGVDETEAQSIVDTVCSRIKEESRKKTLPPLSIGATLIIIGFCIFTLSPGEYTFLLLAISVVIAIFYIRKAYISYKHYKIS